jgi:D-3-phosphoglycerate dehydrogenase
LKTGEIAGLIQDVDAVIAGTEPYTREILQRANRLKVISRVGIGLDNVDMEACKELGISVTYTPEAPSQAVAELTVCNIINLSRHVLSSDRSVRETTWNRHLGVLLEELTIGVVGVGRIGKRVCMLLQPFHTKIRACDLEPDFQFGKEYGLEWATKNELFQGSDLVTLHIPYHARNHHFVDRETIARMKTGGYLINTSRGGIVDEEALTDALLQKHLSGAALDVFEKEPYEGILAQLDNVILTAHIGASARASRFLMELGAAEDCIRVLKGEKPGHDAILESAY